MDFIAFDLETTGFTAGVDQIVEIGAIRIENNKMAGRFSTLVNPGQKIPEASMRVHKITDEMVADSPSIDKVLPKFTEFCKGSLMVAHNSSFDFQFLKASYEKEQITAPDSSIVDTLQISRKAFPGLANYKLGTLVEYLKIKSNTFHRAEDDAYYCAQVFYHAMKKIFPSGEYDEEKIAQVMTKPVLKFPKIENSNQQFSFF